jgi:hypothetical protein
MKKQKLICWILKGKEILFKLNWLEYLVMKRIFNERNYKINTLPKLRGEKINLVVVDEYAKYPLKNFKKRY